MLREPSKVLFLHYNFQLYVKSACNGITWYISLMGVQASSGCMIEDYFLAK